MASRSTDQHLVPATSDRVSEVPSHRPAAEGEPLSIHQGGVPHGRQRVNALPTGPVAERADDGDLLLAKFLRRQADNPVQDHGAPVGLRTVLGGAVQVPVETERSAGGGGGANVCFYGIRLVRLPRTEEIGGVPDSALREKAVLRIRVQEAKPALALADGDSNTSNSPGAGRFRWPPM